MKRRRDLGPKRVKNRPALIKFIILALIIAAIGIALALTANYLIGPPPQNSPQDSSQDSQEKKPSLIYLLPGLLGIITFLAVIALLFFGFRAYIMGTKARKTIQAGRKKIKPKN